MSTNELWEKLEIDGLTEVRKKRAEGLYGAGKHALVDEWIHQKEKNGGLIIPPDPEREKLFQELSSLELSEFKSRIIKEKDDGRLGFLRYSFNWNPDPRKSTWQAIEINRLLTKRKQARALIPTWIGIGFASILSIASLIVSIISVLNKT